MAYLAANYDMWFSERNTVPEFFPSEENIVRAGSLARPAFDHDLPVDEKRCTRCGIPRKVHAYRPTPPLCKDCKGSLTKDQQRKWK